MRTINGRSARVRHGLRVISRADAVLFAVATSLTVLLMGCGQEARSESDVQGARDVPELTERVERVPTAKYEDEEARWATSEFSSDQETMHAEAARSATPATPPANAAAEVRAEPRAPAPRPSRSGPEMGASDPGAGRIIDDVEARRGIETAEPEDEFAEDPMSAVFVPAGERLVFTVESELNTKDNQPGDVFYAYLVDDLVGADGMVLLPRGLRARGRVVGVVVSEGSDQLPTLDLSIYEFIGEDGDYSIESSVVAADFAGEARDSDGESVVKVLTGAAAGAILGRILGGDKKDAVKGGVAGAAAGAAVAYGTRGGHAKLPAGAHITIQLERRLAVF